MIELAYRQAQNGDCSDIVRLVNRAYRPEPGCEGWTHESALVGGARITAAQVANSLRHAVILLGLQGTTIVACIQIEIEVRSAHLGMLAVDPALQRAGVGKAILAHAEAYARDVLGAEEFLLTVVTARVELIAFYGRRGYADTGQRLPYPVAAGVGTPRDGALDLTVLRKPAIE